MGVFEFTRVDEDRKLTHQHLIPRSNGGFESEEQQGNQASIGVRNGGTIKDQMSDALRWI
jgi:hypothetical protein